MFIRIGGIPGVGKSTVIDKLSKVGKMYGLPIEKVKGGDVLLKLAGVSTYDELRKLPESFRASLRPEMFRIMYEEDRQNPQVIRLRDAHFSLIDPETGQIVTFPLQHEDSEQMLAMIVLTADPEIILTRRLGDKSRSDRFMDLDVIIEEQRIEIETAEAQSKQLDRELVIVDNSPEGLSVYKEIINKAFPEGNLSSTLEAAIFGSGGKLETNR
ncbi:MAG: hypothetical protein UX08_C0012G0062 [Candidatus Collierbacteria bacterium GW2011_GWB1_45_35]|uniref:Adenylate kinase n=1 Tax=Candidatus Collierbacteria bacterium GW2011_GWB2_45_17 TaxID=1618388 RepID=A0A837IKD4_9BACT|nr:MAG: hypothetical protein UW48_C0001G0166 [Microgenomates group bacterium GW2011_GWC1_44_23]KKT96286.1 MAG: hypothetical protein UW96_C0001G0164 [Candidatus Collierbacteria bacterium GW2011_GWA1_45_15]KKU01326.1 MAG: hypothetical protein UX01_C0001G0170 [Candidatus Collierbacteria bacterium GW2011_GWB2_45_17]KKU05029.1 MAG: hypothetical protein UX08_C0012G0062 [Candidatus Collierbacteria bacterium GW2011_GWB1_45_35]HCX25786.1 hypothetical protein [Candidatus Collierbacteria bacterium]